MTKVDHENFLAMYRLGKRNFDNLSLDGIVADNLSGLWIEDCDISGCSFSGCQFEHLHGWFAKSNYFFQCHTGSAIAIGGESISFRKCNMEGTISISCDSLSIRKSIITDSTVELTCKHLDLQYSAMIDCTFRGCSVERIKGNLPSFSGCSFGSDCTFPPQLEASLSILPEEGEIIGWKKCLGGRIVKLRIPPEARRVCGNVRKCRAEFAEVLAIFSSDGSQVAEAASNYNPDFVYKTGQIVRPETFCVHKWYVCSGGIHFFLTRAEAEAYDFN